MQTDLFGTAAINVAQPRTATRTDFLERYRYSLRLDQALVGFISLLVIYVMIFSFGVEKGKRFALAEVRAEREKHERVLRELRDKIFSQQTAAAVDQTAAGIKSDLAQISITTIQPHAQTESAAASVTSVTGTESPKSKGLPKGKYTIQIVTFNSKTQAEKEFKRLGGHGLSPFSIASGKFEQVCVDSFETREQAAKALKNLKNKGTVPADAYVRVIPQPQA